MIGIRIAAFVVFAGILAFDAAWCRSKFPGGFLSLAGYVESTLLLVVATVGVAAALTPGIAWRALAAELVVVFGWGPAVLLGYLVADCGAPAIAETSVMQLLYFAELSLPLPMTLLGRPAGPFLVVAGCCAGALLAWGVARVLHRGIPGRAIVLVAVVSPVVLVLTAAVLRLAGTHPDPAGCAI